MAAGLMKLELVALLCWRYYVGALLSGAQLTSHQSI